MHAFDSFAERWQYLRSYPSNSPLIVFNLFWTNKFQCYPKFSNLENKNRIQNLLIGNELPEKKKKTNNYLTRLNERDWGCKQGLPEIWVENVTKIRSRVLVYDKRRRLFMLGKRTMMTWQLCTFLCGSWRGLFTWTLV